MSVRIVLPLAFVLLCAIMPLTATAGPSPTDLVISEVLYNPTTSSETSTEWIEIFNKGTSAISITTDWQLCDSANCSAFPGAQSIDPGEYWLIVKDGGASLQDEVNLTGTYDAGKTIVMGSWETLNNSGDTVRIYSGAPSSATLMDCVEWGSGTSCSTFGGGTDGAPGSTTDGQSICKVGENWGTSQEVSGETYGGSPYLSNTQSGGTNAIALRSFDVVDAPPILPFAGLAAIGLASIVLWRRTRDSIHFS